MRTEEKFHLGLTIAALFWSSIKFHSIVIVEPTLRAVEFVASESLFSQSESDSNGTPGRLNIAGSSA